MEFVSFPILIYDAASLTPDIYLPPSTTSR